GESASQTNFGAGRGCGGALCVETNTVAEVELTTFAANSVIGRGSGQTRNAGPVQGGAVFSGGTLRLRDCTFDQNKAVGGSTIPSGPGFGGAVVSLATLTLNGCTLSSNLAEGGSYVAA